MVLKPEERPRAILKWRNHHWRLSVTFVPRPTEDPYHMPVPVYFNTECQKDNLASELTASILLLGIPSIAYTTIDNTHQSTVCFLGTQLIEVLLIKMTLTG